MAELEKIARPYAKAAYEFARENDAILPWSQMLHFMSQTAQQPLIAELLKNPECPAKKLASIFIEVAKKELTQQACNFIELLAEQKRLKVLPEIAKLFAEFRARQEKNLKVKTYSVVPLSEELKNNITQKLARKLGCNIILCCETDPSLLGGMVLQVGDRVFDNSIRDQFLRMRESVIKSI